MPSSNAAVPVKDDSNTSLVCRHCNETLPSRKTLMKHIFSDVCKQPPKPQIDPDKHAALQSHYDTLLEEHKNLREDHEQSERDWAKANDSLRAKALDLQRQLDTHLEEHNALQTRYQALVDKHKPITFQQPHLQLTYQQQQYQQQQIGYPYWAR